MNVCLTNIQDVGIILRQDFCQLGRYTQAIRAIDV